MQVPAEIVKGLAPGLEFNSEVSFTHTISTNSSSRDSFLKPYCSLSTVAAGLYMCNGMHHHSIAQVASNIQELRH
jgi:hypothetical protein